MKHAPSTFLSLVAIRYIRKYLPIISYKLCPRLFSSKICESFVGGRDDIGAHARGGGISLPETHSFCLDTNRFKNAEDELAGYAMEAGWDSIHGSPLMLIPDVIIRNAIAEAGL